jgi:hypothetical protein
MADTIVTTTSNRISHIPGIKQPFDVLNNNAFAIKGNSAVLV